MAVARVDVPVVPNTPLDWNKPTWRSHNTTVPDHGSYDARDTDVVGAGILDGQRTPHAAPDVSGPPRFRWPSTEDRPCDYATAARGRLRCWPGPRREYGVPALGRSRTAMVEAGGPTNVRSRDPAIYGYWTSPRTIPDVNADGYRCRSGGPWRRVAAIAKAVRARVLAGWA